MKSFQISITRVMNGREVVTGKMMRVSSKEEAVERIMMIPNVVSFTFEGE